MGFITKLYKKGDSSKTAVTSGSGTQELTVVVPAFTGRETRNDSKEFSTGTVSKILSVTQTGMAVFLKSAQASETTIPRTGGTFSLQGTSNSANIKLASGSTVISGVTASLYINGNLQSDWNGTTNIAVNNDPGATADYTWQIQFTIPENKTESTRQHIVNVSDGSSASTGEHTKQVTFNQSTGVKNYNTPSVSLSYGTLPAGATSMSPSLTISQQWGWNNSNTNGGTITPSYTAEYTATEPEDNSISIAASTGVLTVLSLGFMETETNNNYSTVSVTVTANGKKASTSTTLKREANKPTYGDPVITDISVDDIPASGGTISAFTNCYVNQLVTYTSGSSDAEVVDEAILTYSPSLGVSAGNLGTTKKARTKIGTLTASYTRNGKTGTASADIYQVQNGYNLTYSNIAWSPTSPVALAKGGQSYTISQNATQTVTYESGGTRSGSITYSYTVKTSAAGFSNSSNVVTASNNTSASARGTFVLTATASGEGSKTTSTDISFTQAAGTRSYGNVEILSYTYLNDSTGFATMKSANQVKIAEVAATTDAPVVTYKQTWGWNGATTGGGTITSGAKLTFSDNVGAGGGKYGTVDSSGKITVPSTGSIESPEEKIMEVTLTVTLNGKSASKVMEVWRAANVMTYTLIPNFDGGSEDSPIDYTSETGNDVDIPASGGTRASLSGLKVTAIREFTNGTIEEDGVTVPSSNITYGTSVAASSLSKTVKSRTQVGVLTVTASYGGATETWYVDIYQKANARTYGNVTHSGITSYTFSSGNQADSYTYTVANQNAKQVISYTSGATENGTITLSISRASSSVARLTVSGNTVNITASPYATIEQVGTVTVTLTGQGGKSATYNTVFHQAAGDVTLTLNPETLTFEYTGGEKNVTVTSNSSWTIKN